MVASADSNASMSRTTCTAVAWLRRGIWGDEEREWMETTNKVKLVHNLRHRLLSAWQCAPVESLVRNSTSMQHFHPLDVSELTRWRSSYNSWLWISTYLINILAISLHCHPLQSLQHEDKVSMLRNTALILLSDLLLVQLRHIWIWLPLIGCCPSYKTEIEVTLERTEICGFIVVEISRTVEVSRSSIGTQKAEYANLKRGEDRSIVR